MSSSTLTATEPPDGYPALLMEELSGGRVRCLTCLRRCLILPGKRGWCGTRENRDGRLVSLIYGRVASLSLNPIEKKPVYHFLPGSYWLSLGSLGCNFRCPGCQNWELAHADLDRELHRTRYISPAALVELAQRHKAVGISWTFNEPVLWLEYILDTAPLAKAAGLFTNIVTNGALTPEAMDALGPYLDVYRVDIKGYFNETYERLAKFPHAQAIREAAVKGRKEYGLWVEAVTNVIPGVNDSPASLTAIVAWLAQDVSPATPWHATRFHPALAWRDLSPTPVTTLEFAVSLAQEAGLRFPYLGNVPGHPRENTFCPACGQELIRRFIFDITALNLEAGCCSACGTPVPGLWL
jgi:pyruvate formate lyase activating enzyme